MRLSDYIIIGLAIALSTLGFVPMPDTVPFPHGIRLLPHAPNPYQAEYEQMLFPTVRVLTPSGTGSGVVIETTDEHGSGHTYILSAAHVVGNEATVKIETFYPFRSEIEASVIITDTAKDLALLSIEPRAKSKENSALYALRSTLYSARLAPRDYTPWLFTPVYTIGCSLGLPPRPSTGIITAINQDYWEVSSPILPGNSGGPVYDAKTYEVIGIAVWVHTYKNQLVTTMAGIVPIQSIYEFLDNHQDTKAPRK